MTDWFKVDDASRAFVDGAGEGVKLLSLTVCRPEVRELEAFYSFDGLPGKEFFIQMRHKGTCADVAKLMGRRAAATIDIECRS